MEYFCFEKNLGYTESLGAVFAEDIFEEGKFFYE